MLKLENLTSLIWPVQSVKTKLELLVTDSKKPQKLTCHFRLCVTLFLHWQTLSVLTFRIVIPASLVFCKIRWVVILRLLWLLLLVQQITTLKKPSLLFVMLQELSKFRISQGSMRTLKTPWFVNFTTKSLDWENSYKTRWVVLNLEDPKEYLDRLTLTLV